LELKGRQVVQSPNDVHKTIITNPVGQNNLSVNTVSLFVDDYKHWTRDPRTGDPRTRDPTI